MMDTNIKEIVTSKKNNYKKNNNITKYHVRKKWEGFKILYSDIETIIQENKHHIICVSIILSDNSEHTFENIDDYMNFVLLNNEKSIIYFHNFGRFDSNFILKYITKKQDLNYNTDNEIKIIERNNIIYEILFKKKQIYFRDSILLIPLSLRDISNTFCTQFKKLDFEYNKINHIYETDKTKIYELCIQDCRVLKEGFENFDKLIFEKFKLKIHHQLSLSSLSFNIFRSHYYDPDKTPISKNNLKMDHYIRKSYKGGICDVYKPFLFNGFCYDANSLYPSIMHNQMFPIGDGQFVKKCDIDLNSFIGFIKCHIKCINDIGFLTYRDKERGLITPTGEWIDVLTHCEVNKAIELGYEINIINGLKYKSQDTIFDEFVKELYEIRQKATNKATNQIAKLLLNSLYGRFGMKIDKEQTKFLSGEKISQLKEKYLIKNIDHIGNDFYMIRSVLKIENYKDEYSYTKIETAVQIASFITAYSRIFMYDFKNISNNKCIYSDTDSLFLQKPLDNIHLGSSLYKFKLVYKVKRAYFIAPKVYYILTSENEEKFVVKGMKKDEIDKKELLSVFSNMIIKPNNNFNIFISRINAFKRNFKTVDVEQQHTKINPKFPFNKRVKRYDKWGRWISTTPLEIRDLSEY